MANTALLKIKDQYGPEAVVFLGHTTSDFWFTDYLAQAWGSPNAASPRCRCAPARARRPG